MYYLVKTVAIIFLSIFLPSYGPSKSVLNKEISQSPLKACNGNDNSNLEQYSLRNLN
ncbi:hypothetical protein SAMN03097699_0681 [Flavobacteriaceae bacterium MAR_2010_188]|nr:hypothetical protein SAMN03097699_0681 [Flavobacteriaceae bacterium MAR_2010_188]